MADKSRNQDTEAQPISDAERIARLEKRGKLQMLLIVVLMVLSAAQAGGLVTLFVSEGDNLPSENRAQLETQAERLNDMQAAFKSAESFALQSQVLEAKVERILGQGQLNNFTTLREMLLAQESNYQQFLGTTKQGMKDLSRMVRGSRTWYDFYAEQIDVLLANSDRRERLLQGLKAQP